MSETSPSSPESSIPPLLEERLHEAFSATDAKAALAGFEAARSRPVTLRANRLKATPDDVAAALDAAALPHERIPWFDDAFVLGDNVVERDVWPLDLYRDGGIYLQSLSSMLPPLVLVPRPRADILDMCAAPGGKTLEMASLEPTARITACELNAPRAERLEYNLAKQGAVNVQVMRTDARQLDEFFSFDQVLLDAPCTGSGTLRAGDARAVKRITPALLAKVTKAQAALLDRALTVLKPGGMLIYSTCSILPEENDEQVKRVLSAKRHRDCELISLKLPEGLLDLLARQEETPDPLPEGEAPGEVSSGASGGAPGEASDAASGEVSSGASGGASGAEPGARFMAQTLRTELPETLTICPTRLFEGFYLAAIKRG